MRGSSQLSSARALLCMSTLKDGKLNHIKVMIELFDELSVELRKRIECFIFWPVFLTLTMQWSTKVKNIGGGGGGGGGQIMTV